MKFSDLQDASFKSFLWDTFIRSHDFRENLYEDTESLTGEEKEQLLGPFMEASQVWKKIYDQRVNYLKQNVTLNDRGNILNIHEVEFHPRFGWTVIHEHAKAFLGKVSLILEAKIRMGVRTYFSGPGIIRGQDLLSIGSYCCIAENVYINLWNDAHPMTYPSIYVLNDRRMKMDGLDIDMHLTEFKRGFVGGVSIGNDVWMGRNVRIYNGINIGDGCIIGEGSLVRQDCEPYGIYAGIPARLIRYRFDEKVIEQLLEIKWWNWTHQKMKINKDFFNMNLTEYRGSLRDIIKDSE